MLCRRACARTSEEVKHAARALTTLWQLFVRDCPLNQSLTKSFSHFFQERREHHLSRPIKYIIEYYLSLRSSPPHWLPDLGASSIVFANPKAPVYIQKKVRFRDPGLPTATRYSRNASNMVLPILRTSGEVKFHNTYHDMYMHVCVHV